MPIGAAVIIFSPLKVVDAGHILALGPDVACPRVRVCPGVHSMEPMVGRDASD